jgi:hypothetical protein
LNLAKKKVTQKKTVKKKINQKSVKKSVKRSSPKSVSIAIQTPLKNRLDPFGFAYTLGILNSVAVLILGIFGYFGYCLNAVEIISHFSLTFSISAMGIIGGVAEAGICGMLAGLLFALLYNKLA